MKRILITGMSGTGKSTVTERLASMGRKAIDADSDVWSEWRIVPVAGDPTGDSAQPDWVWREDRIQRLLDTEDVDVLYISGCAANQGRFYDQLDHVVLLSAPTDVMMDRIANRTTNPFGKRADERAKILSDTRTVVPLLRARADIEMTPPPPRSMRSPEPSWPSRRTPERGRAPRPPVAGYPLASAAGSAGSPRQGRAPRSRR